MNESVKEVRDSIKRLEDLKKKVHKEMGIKTVSEDIVAGDMYEYAYSKPDLDGDINWIILHGRCIDARKNVLAELGYQMTVRRHIPQSDKSLCRTKCGECGDVLDSKQAERYLADRDKRLANRHADYIVEKQVRAEWEAEQILLGKM